MRKFIPLLITVCIAVFLFSEQEAHAQALDTLKIKVEVDSLIALGQSLRKTYDYHEATKVYKIALALIGTIDYDAEKEGVILGNLGSTLYYTGQVDEALKMWKEAVTTFNKIGNNSRESDILNNIGYIYQDRGDYDTAIEYFTSSLEVARAIQDTSREANRLNSLGGVHVYMNDYSKALNFFQKSLVVNEEFDDRVGVANSLSGIGNVYYNVNDYTSAQRYFLKALEIFQETDHKRGIVITLSSLGDVCLSTGDYDEGLAFYKQSLELSSELNMKELEAEVLNDIGVAYSVKGEYPSAWKYIDSSWKIVHEMNILDMMVRNIQDGGNIFMELGEYEKALSELFLALELFKRFEDKKMTSFIYAEIAKAYSNQKSDSIAVTCYEKAINIAEKLRGKLEVASHKSTFTASFAYFYSGIVHSLLNIERDGEAYNYIERCRARSFLDILASSNVAVGKSRHAEFLQKEEELQEHKSKLEEQIATVDNTLLVAELRGKLEEEWGSINALIDEKKQYEPELVSMVTVNPLTLTEVQDQMDPKSTILEYMLTEEKTIIWLITPSQLEVYQVEVGGDSIASLVRGFRDAIVSGSSIDKRARKLYDILIVPAEKKIKTKNLTIIPHGYLHYLPFQALQNQKGKYLVDRYDINYLPSASVLKYLEPKKRSKGKTLLAIGNPATHNEEYKSLPFAEQEVNQIAEFYKQNKLLIGEAATEDEVRKLAPKYDILHLACHSELNSAYPLFSGLILAPGDEQDGELDVHEIFTMDLNADLIVLSACQTGLGHLTTGDELVGLSRAFIYAGTPTVLSSLWVIQDESTAYLMAEFYKNLKKYDKAEALCKAQISTKKKYPSPYHWASFVLIGDPE